MVRIPRASRRACCRACISGSPTSGALAMQTVVGSADDSSFRTCMSSSLRLRSGSLTTQVCWGGSPRGGGGGVQPLKYARERREVGGHPLPICDGRRGAVGSCLASIKLNKQVWCSGWPANAGRLVSVSDLLHISSLQKAGKAFVVVHLSSLRSWKHSLLSVLLRRWLDLKHKPGA